MFNRRTYLDFASGIGPPAGRHGGNPSSPHEEGRRAKEILENARITIARLIEVQPDDVIFTGGATEANALAILGVARKGDHVFYLPSSHASVVENMKLLAEREVEIEELPIKNWQVDCKRMKELLRPETVMIAMDAVCGETGVVWNTREVAETLRGFRAGKPKKESAPAARPIQLSFSGLPALHIDASQAPFTEKMTRAHFSADMMTLDSSKVGTTRGIGALIAHRTIPIEPLYRGGGQERGLRPGSESPELAEEFAAALCAAAQNRESFRISAKKNRAQLIKAITDSIPNALLNEGPSADGQAPHILNLSFPGRDTDYLVALLDEAGFAVSTRSACETDSENGSRAVFALTGDEVRARSTLRISWGPDISSRELARFAKALIQAIVFVDTKNWR